MVQKNILALFELEAWRFMGSPQEGSKHHPGLHQIRATPCTKRLIFCLARMDGKTRGVFRVSKDLGQVNDKDCATTWICEQFILIPEVFVEVGTASEQSCRSTKSGWAVMSQSCPQKNELNLPVGNVWNVKPFFWFQRNSKNMESHSFFESKSCSAAKCVAVKSGSVTGRQAVEACGKPERRKTSGSKWWLSRETIPVNFPTILFPHLERIACFSTCPFSSSWCWVLVKRFCWTPLRMWGLNQCRDHARVLQNLGEFDKTVYTQYILGCPPSQ